MKELEKKVAIVTGGARGIGKAICQTLAEEGAHVVVCDIDYEVADQTAAEIVKKGFSAFPIKVDVSCGKEVKEAFKDILDRFKRVDILVNNAGLISLTPLEDIDEEEWDRVLAVNLKGVFLCSQATMQTMMSQKGGRIVNIASLAGKVGGLVAGAHYSASKAGVICLTKSLAQRMAPYGVNVNAVAPGLIETETTNNWPEEVREKLIRQLPLARPGSPEDVAQTVLFLVSEKTKYITGEIIDVNGGIFMD